MRLEIIPGIWYQVICALFSLSGFHFQPAERLYSFDFLYEINIFIFDGVLIIARSKIETLDYSSLRPLETRDIQFGDLFPKDGTI